jgi:hypothetical protein
LCCFVIFGGVRVDFYFAFVVGDVGDVGFDVYIVVVIVVVLLLLRCHISLCLYTVFIVGWYFDLVDSSVIFF